MYVLLTGNIKLHWLRACLIFPVSSLIISWLIDHYDVDVFKMLIVTYSTLMFLYLWCIKLSAISKEQAGNIF